MAAERAASSTRSGATSRSSASWAPARRRSAGRSRLGSAATFLDLDQAIEERAGKSISELFAERGESGFRAIEQARGPGRAARRPSPP